MTAKSNNIGGNNQDNGWIGYMLLIYVVLLVLMHWLFAGCSPKVVVQKETVIEYRDREIHDTTSFEIPLIVEKNVTRDTLSHLENRYAKSDAVVSGGLLHHSLESVPQIVKVPYEVHVTDTLYKEAKIVEKEVMVDKPLSAWRKFKMEGFWFLLVGLFFAVFAIIKLIKK